MNQTYTAVVKRDGEWWIGWVEEVLSKALVMNREEAGQAAGAGYEEFALTL